jgi:cytochrome c2
MKPEALCRRLVGLAAMALLAGCGAEAQAPPAFGDADNGRLLLRQFACGRCHRIPGVATADGKAGPPLEGLSRRSYLAGRLPNSPEHAVRWIVAPQGVKPGSAMPHLGVTETHARDMVAYLYTLR